MRATMIQLPIPVVVKKITNSDPACTIDLDSLCNCLATATRIGLALIMTPDASQEVTNLVRRIVPSRPREPGRSVTFKKVCQLPHEVLISSKTTPRLRITG